jgi:hypothetical protein
MEARADGGEGYNPKECAPLQPLMYETAPGPAIEPVTPQNEQVVREKRPLIQFKLHDWTNMGIYRVIMRLNGQDVSSGLVVQNCMGTYLPTEDLADGDYWVHIIVIHEDLGFTEGTWIFGVYTEPATVLRQTWGSTGEPPEFDLTRLIVEFDKRILPEDVQAGWVVWDPETQQEFTPSGTEELGDGFHRLTFPQGLPPEIPPGRYRHRIAGRDQNPAKLETLPQPPPPGQGCNPYGCYGVTMTSGNLDDGEDSEGAWWA